MIKKILISQPKPTSEKSPYFEMAKEFNVELVFRPFIKVEGLSSKEFRQQKVSIVGHTAVVFTSSVTHALNQVIGGLTLNKGDTVYITPYEHNAVARTLHLYQKIRGYHDATFSLLRIHFNIRAIVLHL